MESSGQSSCRGQEDGDGSERPMKKARFAWQVKGKHHPKSETNPVTTSATQEIQDTASTAPVKEHISLQCNICDNKNNDSQGFVNNAYKITEETSINDSSSSRIAFSNPTRDFDRQERERENIVRDVFELNEFGNETIEDQYLLQWQTQQMVACCIDNTINRITDRRMQAPPVTGATNARALNMAQFLNHLPGDNTIENEGILMAISAHGLRNNITHSDDDSDDYDDANDRNIPTFLPIYENPIPVNELPVHQEPVANDDDDVGFFDDLPDNSEDDSHFQFMNAAVQFAIISKGLTASGT